MAQLMQNPLSIQKFPLQVRIPALSSVKSLQWRPPKPRLKLRINKISAVLETGKSPVISEPEIANNNNVSSKGVMVKKNAAMAPSVIEVDSVTEADLKENGFRSTKRTKLVCTIGPASCSFEQLEALAMEGMNVARINLCHGTRDWHHNVIRSVRTLNEEKGYAVAVMMDTEGAEIHMGDLGGAASVKAEDGEVWTFSVRAFNGSLPPHTIQVNYDGFAEDVKVGDELVVDGGMVRFEVIEKQGPDVKCQCTDPGLLLPRANLTFWRQGRLVRERNAMLPTISSKDWLDIDLNRRRC